MVRRGGSALIIDNDGSRSTFGGWFRAGYPHLPSPAEIEAFFVRHGWRLDRVNMGGRFESRADLEAVVRIEFTRADADRFLAGHEGTEVDYAVNLWSKWF